MKAEEKIPGNILHYVLQSKRTNKMYIYKQTYSKDVAHMIRVVTSLQDS